MHHGALGDGLIAVGKGIGELLQAVTVSMTRHLTLCDAVEFGLEVDNPTRFVAGEEVVEVHPDVVCRGILRFEAHVDEVVGDGVVDSGCNRQVLLDPFRVVFILVGVVDVGEEVEAAEGDTEEGAATSCSCRLVDRGRRKPQI